MQAFHEQSKAILDAGRARFLALLLVLLGLASIHAQSIYHPVGLQAGDQYRLAFLTAGTRDGTSGDITDYNAFVTNEANAIGSLVQNINADWYAIASTASVTAIENTATDPSGPGDTGVPVYLVDGTSRVANNYDNLWDDYNNNFLVNPLSMTQFGVVSTDRQYYVWTGTTQLGSPALVLGTSAPSVGLPLALNGRWMIVSGTGASPANLQHPLYAISSVLTVIPEPSASVMVSLLSILAMQGHFRTARG